MIIKDVTDIIEEFAPLYMQESYDNSGLIIGTPSTPITGILLAVDITTEVINEAIDKGANLVITHHPIIFNPIKRLNYDNYVEIAVEMAIKNSINIYAAHTNLDSVIGGTSWHLAQVLGIKDLSIMQPNGKGDSCGFGVIGTLERNYSLGELLELIGEKIGCQSIRHSTPTSRAIRRVALCTGSGGSLMKEAIKAEVDIYITSDLKYNDFMTPSNRFVVLDIGHFESEYCAIDILFNVLSKKMFNFALHKSLNSTNPVHYWCHR